MIDLLDPDSRTAAAGEYVLGTLDDADRAQVDAALPDDTALRAEVNAWQDRLLGLTRHALPATPGAGLWARIEASLASQPARSPAAALPRPGGRRPWWAGWGALAAAACVALAVALTTVLRPPSDAARYVAVLQSPADHATGWLVEVRGGDTVRLVPLGAPAAVPAGRAWQFWTKPQGAAAPTSLGLVKAGQALELPVSRLPGIGPQQLFEITLEPPEGSPTGRPTGPILYVGRTVRL